MFCSKRAFGGDAPAATALGVGTGEEGGGPETHLRDGSGGWGVCLGSRAVRARLLDVTQEEERGEGMGIRVQHIILPRLIC